jgi:hypothetical protein
MRARLDATLRPSTNHVKVVLRRIPRLRTEIVSDAGSFHEKPCTVPRTQVRRAARERVQHTR